MHCHHRVAQRRFWSAAFVVTHGFWFASSLQAEGFRNPPPGAFSLGRAGGRIAHIDDPSAAHHNPANLVDLKDPAAALAATVVYIHVDYDGARGVKAETEDPWKPLPNFFFTYPLMENRLALGLSVTTPYGLSNDWEIDGPFLDPTPLGWRYNAPHYSELKTINFNPSLALALGDKVSVAAGVSAMWSELTFEQYYPWVFFGTEGMFKIKGDGFGFGANAALTWKITDRQRAALTFRSPIQVDYDGDFTIDNIPVGAPAQNRSSFKTDIEFPTIIAAGYGLHVTDAIRLELDLEWLEFSNFDELPIDIGPNQVLLGGVTSLPQQWRDTFTIGLGGDWKFAEDWVLRASYQFYESPVPERTFSPTIPDANQHALTAGLGFHHKRHAMDLAYGAVLYDKRKIDNALSGGVFNGTYETVVHLLSLQYTLRF